MGVARSTAAPCRTWTAAPAAPWLCQTRAVHKRPHTGGAPATKGSLHIGIPPEGHGNRNLVALQPNISGREEGSLQKQGSSPTDSRVRSLSPQHSNFYASPNHGSPVTAATFAAGKPGNYVACCFPALHAFRLAKIGPTEFTAYARQHATGQHATAIAVVNGKSKQTSWTLRAIVKFVLNSPITCKTPTW